MNVEPDRTIVIVRPCRALFSVLATSFPVEWALPPELAERLAELTYSSTRSRASHLNVTAKETR